MTPETMSALLDECMESSEGPLASSTIQCLKLLNRENYQRVCREIGELTSLRSADGRGNIVIDDNIVGPKAENAVRRQNHVEDARKLLLIGARRDVVHDVTGMHPREIGKLRDQLGVSKCQSIRTGLTAAEQGCVRRIWESYVSSSLSLTNRLLAVRTETDTNLNQIWDLVKEKP